MNVWSPRDKKLAINKIGYKCICFTDNKSLGLYLVKYEDSIFPIKKVKLIDKLR